MGTDSFNNLIRAASISASVFAFFIFINASFLRLDRSVTFAVSQNIKPINMTNNMIAEIISAIRYPWPNGLLINKKQIPIRYKTLSPTMAELKSLSSDSCWNSLITHLGSFEILTVFIIWFFNFFLFSDA